MLKYKDFVLTKEYFNFLNNKKEIINKYYSGYTAKELAEEYGFGRHGLPNYLRKEGIEPRKRGEPTKRQINKFKKTIYQKYGVINPGQIYTKSRRVNSEQKIKNNIIKSKKLSDYSKKIGRWSGKNNPNYGNKIGHNNGFKNGLRKDIGIYVRSSWEANIIRILNFLNIKYEYEKYRIPINNKETILVDLYLPDYKKFVEVKGYWRDDARRKYDELLSKYDINVMLIETNFYKWLINKFKHITYLE